MSLAEWSAARDRLKTMRSVAASLLTLGDLDAANTWTDRANALADTEMHVETECIMCGGDCGITLRPDMTGWPVGRGLCGPCNYKSTSEALRGLPVASAPVAIVTTEARHG